MDNRQYHFLKYTAIVMAIAWVGWSLYDYLGNKRPGDYAYHAGTKYFADGHYRQALAEYEAALKDNPAHIPALRGQAETLILLGQERQAITIYEQLIALQANNAGHYANLGIAYDRLNKHQQALDNYRKALTLDREVGDGPGWLTRFLRNQHNKPPGIAERAAYLQAQFELPEEQRMLRVPEIDAVQRPFKQ